jgi:Zn-dependent alcohol dehydrogenase
MRVQEKAMKSIAAVAHSQRSPFVVEEVELPDLQHIRFDEINRAVEDQLKGSAIKPILEVSAA